MIIRILRKVVTLRLWDTVRGRGPHSEDAISRSAQSHLTTATKDGAQTERHFVCIHNQKEWATLYE